LRIATSRLGEAAWRFLRANHGTSTVEQALFVALVVGASLAAVEGLGIVSHSTFFDVARGMHSETDVGSDWNSGQRNSSDHARRAPEIAAKGDGVLPSRFLLLLIACPFGAACW